MAEHDDRLGCAACGSTRPLLCASCGHSRLKVLRVGVSRVGEELAALLGTEVAEVSGADNEPVPDAAVLVGTEAVLHRVRQAAVVAFLDFDMHLLAPRLSAGEESLGLLARAGRMVGGRATPGAGLVIVQTRQPDHEVLVAATAGNPTPFLERELALRKELALPPNRALAELSGPGSGEFFEALGLEGASIGEDRWLVRVGDHQTLCDRLAATPRPRQRVKVIVDPTGV
jgi:primosomal protein N' (replication factor Y)